jgi:hypothetical protein
MRRPYGKTILAVGVTVALAGSGCKDRGGDKPTESTVMESGEKAVNVCPQKAKVKLTCKNEGKKQLSFVSHTGDYTVESGLVVTFGDDMKLYCRYEPTSWQTIYKLNKKAITAKKTADLVALAKKVTDIEKGKVIRVGEAPNAPLLQWRFPNGDVKAAGFKSVQTGMGIIDQEYNKDLGIMLEDAKFDPETPNMPPPPPGEKFDYLLAEDCSVEVLP